MNNTKTSHTLFQIYVALLLLGFAFLPAVAQAASSDVGAWIPWWSEEAGVKSAVKNINELDIIYPFVFEVNPDGSLRNRVNFDDKHWKSLFKTAAKKNVVVIPSIAWFDGNSIHAVLKY